MDEPQDLANPNAGRALGGMLIFLAVVMVLVCGLGAGIYYLVTRVNDHRDADDAKVRAAEEQDRLEAERLAAQNDSTTAGTPHPPADATVTAGTQPPSTETASAQDFTHAPATPAELYLDTVGRLVLRITGIYPRRKPLQQSPWFMHGGDWTFFALAVGNNKQPTILVGLSNPESDNADPQTDEAFFSVFENNTAQPFLTAFAEACHTTLPVERRGEPRRYLQMPVSWLGTRLRRSDDGTMTEMEGDWVSTRISIDHNGETADLLFNYSRVTRQAEFVESSPAQRDRLFAILCDLLRDGPLPPRTPRTDLTLQATGPRFQRWQTLEPGPGTLVAICGDSTQVAWVTSGATPATRLCTRPLDGTGHTQIWQTETPIVDLQPLGSAGFLLVVKAKPPEKPDTDTPPQPQHDLWIKPGAEDSPRQVTGGDSFAYSQTTHHLASPDGRFIAVPDDPMAGKPTLRLIDLQFLTPKPLSVGIPDSVTDLSWQVERGKTVVYAVSAEPAQQVATSPRYRIDVNSGKIDTLQLGQHAGWQYSPDGSRKAHLHGNQWLQIIRVVEGGNGPWKQLNFSEYDRRALANTPGVQWLSPRYLLLSGPRPVLIDADTAKVCLPTMETDAVTTVNTVSPNFKWVVVQRDGKLQVGEIVLPPATTAAP